MFIEWIRQYVEQERVFFAIDNNPNCPLEEKYEIPFLFSFTNGPVGISGGKPNTCQWTVITLWGPETSGRTPSSSCKKSLTEPSRGSGNGGSSVSSRGRTTRGVKTRQPGGILNAKRKLEVTGMQHPDEDDSGWNPYQISSYLHRNRACGCTWIKEYKECCGDIDFSSPPSFFLVKVCRLHVKDQKIREQCLPYNIHWTPDD